MYCPEMSIGDSVACFSFSSTFLCRPLVSTSSGSGSAAGGAKKSFTADSGLKYQWDDKENDWVECNGPDR
jgi:hypothetical protein